MVFFEEMRFFFVQIELFFWKDDLVVWYDLVCVLLEYCELCDFGCDGWYVLYGVCGIVDVCYMFGVQIDIVLLFCGVEVIFFEVFQVVNCGNYWLV